MDFNTICEFQDRIKEANTKFGYFPEEWENAVLSGEKFIDFARLSTPNFSEEEIPHSKDVTKDYTGFLRLPPKTINTKANKVFVFSQNFSPQYTQLELENGDGRQVCTSFYNKEGNSSLNRIYFGDFYTEPVLSSLSRVLSSKFSDGKLIKVFQRSKDYFDIQFLKNKEKNFSFFLDGDNYKSHKNFVDAIKAFPEIFSDLDLFQAYFSVDFFEGYQGNSRESSQICLSQEISKWERS
ncbi:MAG: hypothetical protein NUV46_04175 [Nanoarchaeota archaeon]|nr:hypothetical protein [Nanoarchaeota archaeon]